MSDGGDLPRLASVLIILILLMIFSLVESAYRGINRIRLNAILEEKGKRNKSYDDISEKATTLWIFFMFARVVLYALLITEGAAYIYDLSGGRNMILYWIVFVGTILLVGELIPRTIAGINSEAIALSFALPLKILTTILTPVIFILTAIRNLFSKLFRSSEMDFIPTITEKDLKSMVEAGLEEGVIEVNERTMINNVFEFGDNDAADVMTPRTDIVSAPIDASYEDILDLFENERFSRIPIYKDDLDNIIGILHFKDFIFSEITKENMDLESIIRPPFFSYETKETSKLFAEMRTKGIQMAIILDEHGGTMGLISIEDLVEEIVGDISDEYDDEDEDIVSTGDDEYIVDGATKIEDFNDMAGTDLFSEECETIAGFVIELLGAIPENGWIVNYDNIKFTVEKMDKNRVDTLRVNIARDIE